MVFNLFQQKAHHSKQNYSCKRHSAINKSTQKDYKIFHSINDVLYRLWGPLRIAILKKNPVAFCVVSLRFSKTGIHSGTQRNRYSRLWRHLSSEEPVCSGHRLRFALDMSAQRGLFPQMFRLGIFMTRPRQTSDLRPFFTQAEFCARSVTCRRNCAAKKLKGVRLFQSHVKFRLVRKTVFN